MIEYVERYRNYFEILLAVSICLIGIWVFTPQAHAATVTLGQGDIAYLNETVDLSLVVSWPDFNLAWCSDGEPGCTNPIIYEFGNRNQHKVWIDPNYFKTGSYFRWSGEWNRGENTFALTILPGSRPIKVGNLTAEEATDEKVNTPEKILPNNTHILMARGDPVVYQYHVPDSYTGTQSYLWMFQKDMNAVDSMVLGDPLTYSGEAFAYEWRVPLGLSQSLKEGQYEGYLQYSGYNKMQDVMYKPLHKIASGEKVPVIDTLYDDDLIPDISIYGLTPPLVKERFETVSMNKYVDDRLYPLSMTVEQPSMTFVDYSSDDDGILISGTTNMAPGTKITLMLDPDNYKLAQDVRLHTWTTIANGSASDYRTWNATLNVDWNEMAIGTHTIRARVDSNGIKLETFKDFKVSDVYIMPTPTPARERVVVEEYGWHRITPVITEATKSGQVMITPEETKFVPVDVTTVIMTTKPTVNTSALTPVKTSIPEETIPTIPVEPVIGILSIGVAALVIKKK